MISANKVAVKLQLVQQNRGLTGKRATAAPCGGDSSDRSLGALQSVAIVRDLVQAGMPRLQDCVHVPAVAF